jgi:predicted dehydrogenase
MHHFDRRTFLKSTLFAAAGVSLAPALTGCKTSGRMAAIRVPGPNDTIRVGVVGFGGRGGDHISGIRKLGPKGVKLVALCDVDSKILAAGVDACAKRNEKVEAYRDFRKLLENKDIDAVTFATPNHWHSLQVILACQAGKDVYVEKPVSHNVWEGRQAVNAARKYGRIVQAGTQSRSSFGIREAVAWVQAGNLGKIKAARGLCYKPRKSIGKTEGAQPIPPEVDYDLWCGPAPLGPLLRKRLHYDWHWVWDTGNGDLGNQGIHQMDISRWFLGETSLSPAVFSVGGRLGYVDDGTTPNTQFVYHRYEKAPLIFEVRGLPRNQAAQEKDWEMDRYMGAGVGVVIHCEHGHVLVPNYTGAVAIDKDGKEIKKWSGADDHYENWIKAVRSRKVADLNADILEGHLSSGLCHTGNVSMLCGAGASPAAIREAIQGDVDGLETYGRMAEHLGANGVDLESSKLTLGPVLRMNPKTEEFKGNAKASALLRRNYRAPYVVPKKV